MVDRQLTYSIFANARTPGSTPTTCTWEEWVKVFQTHEAIGEPADTLDLVALEDAKLKVPGVVLGMIPEGEARRETNVLYVDSLSLDLDDIDETKLAKVLTPLDAYAYVIYTTHKHRAKVIDEALRVRVIIPLSRSVTPEEYPQAWDGLYRMTYEFNDKQTKDICRNVGLPSTYDPSVAWSLRNKGSFLPPELLFSQARCDATEAYNTQTKYSDKISNKIKTIQAKTDTDVALKALRQGQPFADHGTRHNMLLDITMWMARQTDKLNRADIEYLFAASLAEMGPDAPSIGEAWTAYQGAVVKHQEWQAANKVETNAALREHQLGDLDPYSEEELEACMQHADCMTEQELQSKWIVQRNQATFFLTPQGYKGPYGQSDLALAAKQHLTRSPALLFKMSKTGVCRKFWGDILVDHGEAANEVQATLVDQCSSYRDGVLSEAVRPRRRLEPKFDPDIDKWLQLMCGDLYPKIIDWLAVAPDLSKLLCAIYFKGPRGCGKTLFPVGVARVWTNGPAGELGSVVGGFNDEIARCPLILGDEQLPKKFEQNITSYLRTLISTTSRSLNRKFLPVSGLIGAVRVVLTANHDYLLQSSELASKEDLDAVAQRFLYIQVNDEASKFLASLDHGVTEYWANEGIARHTLWLFKFHRVENYGDRFAVEGDVSQIGDNILLSNKWGSKVCEWFVRYLLQPDRLEAQGNGLIKRQDGILWVNPQAVYDSWQLYLRTKEECDTIKVSHVINTLSHGTQRRIMRHGGKTIRYKEIDLGYLKQWAVRYGIGDERMIEGVVRESIADLAASEAK